MATPPFLRRLLLTAFAAAFVASVPSVAADPTYIPVPGPGFVGTPPSVIVPQVCDPVPLVCVGPIVQPVPVFVGVQADGFLLAVNSDVPGTDVGPIYNNVTVPVVGTEVPLVLCPATCHVPPLPVVGWGGTVYVVLDGPVPCFIEIVIVSVNPHCVPDSDGDGIPDAADLGDPREMLPPCSEEPVNPLVYACWWGDDSGLFLTQQGIYISVLGASITV